MEKTCTKCGETKALEEFSKSTQVKSGYGAWCLVCTRKAKAESNARIQARDGDDWKDRRRAYVRRYREKYPDRVKEQERSQNLRTKFGISVEQYDAMLADQGGVCVCGVAPGTRRFAVDHDRSCCSGNKSCGKCLRGLLCSNCNTALGLLKESRTTIENLLNYMERHK